jgi:hypothetical protein
MVCKQSQILCLGNSKPFSVGFALNMLFIVTISLPEGSGTEEIDVDILLESLKQQMDESITIPTYVSSVIYFLMNLKTLFFSLIMKALFIVYLYVLTVVRCNLQLCI